MYLEHMVDASLKQQEKRMRIADEAKLQLKLGSDRGRAEKETAENPWKIL